MHEQTMPQRETSKNRDQSVHSPIHLLDKGYCLLVDRRGWFRCSAVGLAALFGLPNVDFPLDDIIDRVFDQIDSSKRNKARALANHAADALAALRHNHGAATVESARLSATDLLLKYGLSDQAFAELALDANKAAATVLSFGSFTADERAEVEPLCLKILAAFYSSLLREPSLLAELLPHIYLVTLRNLDEIKAVQTTIAQKLEHLHDFIGRDQVENIRRENHLTKAALSNMFSILCEQNVSPEHLDAKLRQIANAHVELTERLRNQQMSGDEVRISERRELAAQALGVGDYDLASRLLVESEELGRAAVIQRHESLERDQISITTTVSQRGDLERMRLNYRKAAELFAEAASLAPASADELRLSCLEKQASVLKDLGWEFGESSALTEAIRIYESVIEHLPSDRMPLEWNKSQTGLGHALQILGSI